MPVYDPEIQFLDEAIWSVRNQLYQNWELCIADDCSKNEEVRVLLRKHAAEELRIKVVYREERGHISRATNSALELAVGEFVGFLDHDDLLKEEALYEVVKTIKSNPKVELIYSDEDKINSANKRFDPYFKPDWNLDLFYSHNLLTHLSIYRRSRLQEVNGVRVEFEGAQDYDLGLRFIEKINHINIVHIPKVLYHWRSHSESTSFSSDTKPYAMLNGEKALNEHFNRLHINAKAELIGIGFRIHYELPQNPPLVSLIIPTRNGLSFLKKCIDSIVLNTNYPSYEIIIVDNGSDDNRTIEYLNNIKNREKFKVVRDASPFNYSALNNLGVSVAEGEIIGFINNDIEVISQSWLCEMVGHAIRPGIGAVGAKLIYPNNTLQHAGVVMGIGGWAGHSHKGFHRSSNGYFGRASLVSEFMAVSGACLLMKKDTYLDLGGLNEIDLKIACNDVDLCLKAKAAGFRNIWTPFAVLIHHESVSRGYEDDPIKIARFASEVKYMRNKWGDIFVNDPMYSPNLTLDREDFSFAWPPRKNDRHA